MKALVAGWFSYEDGHATAGDLLARDLTCEWLERAGYPYDVALAHQFCGGVDWRLVDPKNYSHVVFVCGPFDKGPQETKFLDRFAGCRLIGLNLSMLTPLSRWNPFDLLLERDSSECGNPDIAFLSNQERVPVVGVCLVEPYEGAQDQAANAAISRFLNSREMSVVSIDTRLDSNSTNLRTSAEIESLIARMDVVLTTRLHGLVLALKNGIPAIAIDPEAGGAKIKRQAETIGWPAAFNVDAISQKSLGMTFKYCLTEEARSKARECSDRARKVVEAMRDEFILELTRPGNLDSAYLARTTVSSPANSGSSNPNGFTREVSIRDASRWRLLKSIARRTLPGPFRYWLRTRGQTESRLPPGWVQFGNLRRVTPISRSWGFDRGLPVDRYYMNNFFATHANDIRGRVLEIEDDNYTQKHGGGRVTNSDVLHVVEGNPRATIIADLSCANNIASNMFDCIIFPQTLHLIYDVRAVARTLHRILRPGGVLLATFPGISQISQDEWNDSWYWAFTTMSARRLFQEVFPAEGVRVTAHGNVLAACAFLYGLAAEELRREELDSFDPCYELLITLRALKPDDAA